MDFDRFRISVIGDGALTEKLARCDSEAALFTEVLAIGGAHGFRLKESELLEVTRENRRLWLERWMRQ